MPERKQLFTELEGEDGVGVLLMAQMGGVPNELQLFIQTALYDAEVQGLRERNNYMVRVLSVREHRLSLGLFASLFIAQQHPILMHHNEPLLTVHFTGRPADTNGLVLDIHQAHVSTFGPWRELATDINRAQPLVDLLQSGGGELGTMPETVAQRMVRVLEHHGLQAHTTGGPDRETVDEHGRSTQWQLLGVGDSYFVALDFMIDALGRKV